MYLYIKLGSESAVKGNKVGCGDKSYKRGYFRKSDLVINF